MSAVTVRYFAAARAAAGVATEQVELPAGASVEILLKVLRSGGDDRRELARVLERCSLLVDEVAVRDRKARLHEGAVVDVLPPFAGG